MALEDILTSIDRDTKNRVEKLSKETDDEAKNIIKEAEIEAKSHINNMVQKAESEAKSAEIRELSRKRMELKKRYYEELNRTILDAKSSITDNMSEFKSTDIYKNLLNILYKRIIDSLGKECEITIHKDDASLIKFDKGIRVTKSNNLSGGLVGRSEDSSKEIDYTINSIFDIVESDLMVSLSKIITPNTKSTK